MSDLVLREDVDSIAKPNAVERRPYINTICQYANQHGLATQDLRSLLDLAILPSSLNQASRGLIIKSLYPACRVPSDMVYKIASSLGHGAHKPLASVQFALLRWLIMAHCAFEDASALSALYSVFFNLLGRMDIRAPLCHVLAMITKRKHVKPFRLDIIQRLSIDIPREPALEKLMRIFNQLGSPRSDKPGTQGLFILFPHPDPAWGERLRLIQQQAGITAVPTGTYTQSFIFSSVRKDVKIGAESSSTNSRKRSRDAFEMTNVDDIAQHLEDLNVPVPKAQNLNDRLLQQYLSTQSDEVIDSLLDGVLDPLFGKELEGMAKGDEVRRSTLESILTQSRLTTTLPKSTVTFLQTYLKKWDGQKNQGIVLDLLSYLPLQPFEDLQRTHLDAIEHALLSSTSAGPITLLKYYTTLMQQWTTSLSTRLSPIQTSHNTAIHDLSAHINLLLTTILTSPTPRHPATIATILHYLTTLLPLVQPPLSLALPPPPSLLLYVLLFTSPTLQTLHTVSLLLATFKTAFEPPSTPPPPAAAGAAASSSSTTIITASPRPSPQSIHALNATLIDACNLIFRSRAFNASDAHALGCLVPPATRTALETYVAKLELGPGLALGAMFGLSCHPALAAVSIAALKELEEQGEEEEEEEKEGKKGQEMVVRRRHAGPVTQRSLGALAREGGVKISWKEYRVLVLKWLEAVGVGGIGDLGRATMRGLGMGGSGTGGRESTEGVTAA